jgi:hypothetical protein
VITVPGGPLPEPADDGKRRRLVAPRRDIPQRPKPGSFEEPKADLKQEPGRPAETRAGRSDDTMRCSIFKLEELFCSVIATRVSDGSRGAKTDQLPVDLKIDQRTKREHCKTHIDRSMSVQTWHLRAETRKDCEGFDDLCDYLTEKDRVGIARGVGTGYVYIVPPTKTFLEYFRFKDTKAMTAVQVEGQRS